MKIKLTNLLIKNFKGIKGSSIDFGNVTSIKGENATGKTTIFDAFTWLLFDKDSQDRSKFEVQPLDANNNIIHMLDTEVEGVIDVNGKILTLKKILKEKWTRKRGEEQAELKGTETSYYIDEVPVKMSEYKTKINGLIDENLFKLLSNPLYFSTNMKWQDRRTVLLDIIGDVTSGEVINYKDSLKALEALLVDKDIDTLKKQIQARKKILNEDKKSIPSRVDENTKSIKEIDFDAIEFRKRGIVGGIKSLEDQITGCSKGSDEVLSERDKLYTLKAKEQDMAYKAEVDAEKPLEELKKQFRDAGYTLGLEKNRLIANKREIEKLEKTIAETELIKTTLKDKWHEENKKIFELPANAKSCPTCRRDFEMEDIEAQRVTLEGNFNENKAKHLKDISIKGQALNVEIEKLKEKIKNIEIEKFEDLAVVQVEDVKNLESKINNYIRPDPLVSNKEYIKLKIEISELENKLQQPATATEQIKDLRERKDTLQASLMEINELLSHKKSNEDLKKRIDDLMGEEQRLSQQIAELEGQEYLCEEYIKTKVELLEGGINDKFKYVTFKLFNKLGNGGISECCEALIQGVPFTNANTAGQINAGLDVIKTLSEHYEVNVPLFIDNKESINKLIETDSQIINLIVSLDKNLKIESEAI
ncbi:AAA family ATPase [Clostridium sp.]|uniref:AAA family ATPase n=1 Tax=Clostridium sp. TaxID=1506 RepID=UPI0025C2DC91|nr:AAA family ATPase [Clostridium sp.]